MCLICLDPAQILILPIPNNRLIFKGLQPSRNLAPPLQLNPYGSRSDIAPLAPPELK